MKDLKLTLLFDIMLVVCIEMNGQTLFSSFNLQPINCLKYFAKTFSQDRFQIKSALVTIMTFHKGTSSENAKASFGQSELPFSTANYKLYVEDGILSESVKVANPTSWSDFVFYDSYTLKDLDEVDAFIPPPTHLPDVPSEAEIKARGYYDQHEINKLLQQKIEELTLYVIEQQKLFDQMEQLLMEPNSKKP